MDENEFISTATLLCEPSRAKLVWNLLDGRAYTASELALASDQSATSVSNHLSKLLHGGIVKVDVQGRHRYYSFADPEVAYVVEALANLSIKGPSATAHRRPTHDSIKFCRSCYDHLAGKMGVIIADRLIFMEIIKLRDNSLVVTEKGVPFFSEFGLDLNELQKRRRHFAKPCLDWSERKYHVSGALGAALMDKMLRLDWLRKTKNSRAIIITSIGKNGLKDLLGIDV